MLTSYIKTTISALLKNRLYSFINIVGLAIGLASVTLIGLFVQNELSYDRYHDDSDNIYRVTRDFYASAGSQEMFLATNAPMVGTLLTEDFPEIEAATRISGSFDLTVEYQDIAYIESNLRFVDNNIFDFFNVEWVSGGPESAFSQPNSIVLTESLSQRYFGSTDPLGETLAMPYGLSFVVTGLVKDLPENTHLAAEAFGSLQTVFDVFGPDMESSWGNNSYYTYVKLEENASTAAIESAFPDFMDRHYQESASRFTGMRIQTLKDIHLYSSEKQFPMKTPGNINTVLTFVAVAICILLIACFNFMNLSIASSTVRSKEVGMRKAIGARRSQVITQFLGESVLAALLALVLGLVLVEMVLPIFNTLLGVELSIKIFSEPALTLVLIAVTFISGLMAGIYPAIYLSGFQSTRVLRGDVERGKGGQLFRNCLVVLQFSAAIALVVATAVVYLQLNFARTLDLGYEKDQVLVLHNLDGRWNTLRNELERHPDIVNVTASNIVPSENNGNAMLVRYEGGPETGRGMQYLLVDYDFFETYEINLLAGRDFSAEFITDRAQAPDTENPTTSATFIVSEMAVRQMGWTPESALGKWFEMGSSDTGFTMSIRGQIIGVVPDIHFESVATPVEPAVYLLPAERLFGGPSLESASIRYRSSNSDQTLQDIDQLWNTILPDVPLSLSFLNDDINALYQQERNQGELFTWFSAVAIIVACLGLFGLASFNARRRTKEIGVRKVMGSSVMQIVMLLTNDFSKLVLISNVLAWPIAYMAMENWLEAFAYRIDLTPLVFIGSGLIALCITWVTVGSTAAKAASQKPVLALRYE